VPTWRKEMTLAASAEAVKAATESFSAKPV
jgi:hypothetical protein